MARIYFNSPSGSADIRGVERYHAEQAVRDHMWKELGGEEQGIELLRPYLPDFWQNMPAREIKYFLNASRSFGGGVVTIDGYDLDLHNVALSSSMKSGSDGLRLLARLHAQCEIYCWVEGHNRAWLAHLIRAQRTDGILRKEVGWEELADFLLSRDDEPVVCSYSGSDDFPNYSLLPQNHRLKKREAAGEDIDDIFDAWCRMRWTTQWKLCMQELRKLPGRLELRPDDWETYHFGDGITADRLAAVLKEAATTEDDVTSDIA